MNRGLIFYFLAVGLSQDTLADLKKVTSNYMMLGLHVFLPHDQQRVNKNYVDRLAISGAQKSLEQG